MSNVIKTKNEMVEISKDDLNRYQELAYLAGAHLNITTCKKCKKLILSGYICDYCNHDNSDELCDYYDYDISDELE